MKKLLLVLLLVGCGEEPDSMRVRFPTPVDFASASPLPTPIPCEYGTGWLWHARGDGAPATVGEWLCDKQTAYDVHLDLHPKDFWVAQQETCNGCHN